MKNDYNKINNNNNNNNNNYNCIKNSGKKKKKIKNNLSINYVKLINIFFI